MRRSLVRNYYWSRYRIPTQPPKFDGPAPVAAPQNMNNTKTNEFIDPIDDKFPKSIRGNIARPDVPTDQYVESWYVCDTMVNNGGDLRPWSSSAPANAFRFRPYNEFDSKGREVVKQLREFDRYDAAASIGRGQEGFPFREAYLTSMNPENNVTTASSLHTIMTRAVSKEHNKMPRVGPLEVQRDVGRIEAVIPTSGSLDVNKSRFPFSWKTEDWYEYEVSKVRMKRFKYENENGVGLRSSEVTYKIILEGQWDHHVARLADDVTMFFKEVGRQIVEEKLVAVRKQLDEVESGKYQVDPEMVKAFQCSIAGPFGSADQYDSSEIATFLARELRVLEQQCVNVINRCNIAVPGAMNLYDENTSWPFVERLEPWVRMAEYWTGSSDTSYTELEMSTAHAEFRRYFRVVVVKLPFQSSEFEKRMYDIRHWLHRQCSAEFQTIYKRNHVHDAGMFPTEHDPTNPTTHEHHRMFSFALDWQQAPAEYQQTVSVQPGDSWQSIAERIGCSEVSLKLANSDLEDPQAGSVVSIPADAARRGAPLSRAGQLLPLVGRDGNRLINSWEDAASALNCSTEELQQSNGPAAVTYDSEKNCFHSSVVHLLIPLSASMDGHDQNEFASTETVMKSDTVESIATRLGCTAEELMASNPGLNDIQEAAVVNVPKTSRFPRRLTEPLLRSTASSMSLIPRTLGEEQTVPEIPHKPANAGNFPHEYHTSSSRFPTTPRQAHDTHDWLSYTSTYLDKELGASSLSEPLYTVNRLWPMQQVPGKVDQTPFEEDQTWMMHHIPVQQMEQHHPEKDLQDLPFTNHEQFSKSIEWTAP